MDVAHLTWLLSSRGGGIPPVALALANEQRRAGHAVRVLGVEDPLLPNEPGVGELHKAVGPVALGFAPGLDRALRRNGPEVLHLHGLFTWSSEVASSFGARTKHPVVVSPHGMLEPWALGNSAWKKRLFRLFIEDRNLARARCLHALCDEEAENFRRLGLKSPVAIVPNGVALEDVPGTPDRGALGRTYPELAGRRILLFLGRVHPKKGLLPLLDAWRTLRDSGVVRDWVLVIAGPDQVGHAGEVAARIGALGLGKEVRLHGPAYGEAKRDVLAAADAFVLPSFSEGFSMAVLEAMAWRLPVLVSRQCNLDVEGPGQGSSASQARPRWRSACTNYWPFRTRRAARWDAFGRAEVEKHDTWPVVAAQLIDVYRWLLGGGVRPATVEAPK